MTATAASCSLSSRGGGEVCNSEPNTHFGIIFFSFVFLLSFLFFFKLVSMRGKGEKSPFQYRVVRCCMHANQALDRAVVLSNRSPPLELNSCMCGLALAWCIPI